MRVTYSSLFTLIFSSLSAQLTTVYEKSGFTETATYKEAMAFYQTLSVQYDDISIYEHGPTDVGVPIQVVLITTGKEKTPLEIQQSGKAVWLINNAIHPGEPDGISASQLFARDLMENKRKYHKVLDKVVIAIIPFYNIGGVLNRNGTTRVNQNGPNAYGFRGNARNYDLNRDFIKSDTRNSQSFQALYHQYDPDLLLDTHVSNGSDYQHIMTLVSPQKDKMGGPLGKFIEEVFVPTTFQGMKDRGFDAVPYVNAGGESPNMGWTQFLDLPRYSTGYAALFHTIGYMSETHMLKTYQQRVESTYALMHTMLDFLGEKGEELVALREQTKVNVSDQSAFEISWSVDTSKVTNVQFSGYEETYVESEVSGFPRLKYDRNRPFTKSVPYSNHYVASKSIIAPKYYVIPQQWHRIIHLMTLNQIDMIPLEKDSIMLVGAYEITDYQTFSNPYEGHYKHYDVQVSTENIRTSFKKGDLLVPVNQWRNRYIVETLEPEAPDSFFAWNFFDTILQQKEHFSAYVFEEHAVKILKEHPELREKLEEAKANDPLLAKSAYQQLDFIYQRSVHREPEYLRYPIFRIIE